MIPYNLIIIVITNILRIIGDISTPRNKYIVRTSTHIVHISTHYACNIYIYMISQ